jgi:hypothetical protein
MCKKNGEVVSSVQILYARLYPIRLENQTCLVNTVI